MRVNQVFYETIGELSVLNEKYISKNPTLVLADYYETKPFILAEEVVIKMEELIFDEKDRVKRQAQKDNLSLALAVASIIPVGAITAKVGTVVNKLRTLKKGIDATEDTTKFLAKVTEGFKAQIDKHNDLIEKSKTVVHKSKYLANYIGKRTYHDQIENIDQKVIHKTTIDFKSPDNKLPGRILDFSDGVISQPIANLRLMMKQNLTVLQ